MLMQSKGEIADKLDAVRPARASTVDAYEWLMTELMLDALVDIRDLLAKHTTPASVELTPRATPEPER